MLIHAIVGSLLIGAAPRPAPVKTFRDWAVGCDNGLACQAVSLIPDGDDEGSSEMGLATLIVRRDGAPTALPMLTLRSDVDAAAVAVGALRFPVRDDVVEAPDPLALAAVVAQADRLLVLDARDKTVAVVSGAGASAAFRFLDDVQKRVATKTAIVARGPATRVPPPPALPMIKVPKPSAKPPAPTRAVDLSVFVGKNDCDADPEDFSPEVHRLDATHTLVLAPSLCGNGMYNFYSSALVVTEGRAALTKATFDRLAGMGGDDADPSLVNASYNPTTRQLSTLFKGRALGDCGLEQSFVWDGARFRLVEHREMPECRGAIDFIVTWRAMVR
jgi:hypothetical protein